MKPPAIGGSTRLLGVIGWPVRHSLSPAMHNAALRAAGLDYVYVAMPVAPERIHDALRGLGALGFAGVNVTIPHKVAAHDASASLTDEARLAGAVNTLRVADDGTLSGHNTDIDGILGPLAAEAGISATSRPESCLIIGAGGAARAAAVAAGRLGIPRVAIANRTLDRAAQLAADFAPVFPAARWESLPLDGAAAIAPGLVLHMTAAGMHDDDPTPLDIAALPMDAVVLDAVYRRGRETSLVAAVRRRGIRAIGGLSMLVAQGASALTYWTGRTPDRAVMRAAAEAE